MYGSIDTLKARIPEQTLAQLSDDTQSGEVDEAIVLECGAAATAKVNGYLRGAVDLPLPASFPDLPLIISLERALWAVELYLRRPGRNPPEMLQLEADKAETTLKSIKARTIVLDLGEERGVTSGLGMTTDKGDSDRVFNAEILSKW